MADLVLGRITFGTGRLHPPGDYPFVRHGAPAADRIANPRSAIEMLLEDRRITRREFNAGWFFAEADRRDSAIAFDIHRAIVERLDRAEIDYVGLVTAVCLKHKLPRTTRGMERFRRGLQMIADLRDEMFDDLPDDWNPPAE